MAAVFISYHRAFWNDETISLSRAYFIPWQEYALGHTTEGNRAPLFFLILKGLFISAPFVPIEPILWIRMVAILPMTFAVVGLFDFALSALKAQRFRLPLAVALVLAIVGSYPFQEYCWQARHYGLWVLGTLIYTRMLLSLVLEKRSFRYGEWFLISGFLCSTVSFGLLQILTAEIFLLLNRMPRKAIFQFSAASVLPAAYVLFCRMGAPEFVFVWPGFSEFRYLILADVRWWAILGFGGALFLLYRQKATFWVFLNYAVSVFFSLGLIIGMFWLQRNKIGEYGVPNRYFLFILPQLLLAMLMALERIKVGSRARDFFLGGLTVVLLVVGAKGILPVLKKIHEPSTFQGSVQSDLKSFDFGRNGDCLCIDLDASRADPMWWMGHVLKIGSRNFHRPDHCVGARPLRLEFPETMQPVIVTAGDRQSEFYPDSGICCSKAKCSEMTMAFGEKGSYRSD